MPRHARERGGHLAIKRWEAPTGQNSPPTGIAAPGETSLQPEEAKALAVYAARAALRHTLPVEEDDTEWLTPEQTEIVWENPQYGG